MAIRKTNTKYSGTSMTRKGLTALRQAVFISNPNKRSIPKEQLINIVNIMIVIKIIFIYLSPIYLISLFLTKAFWYFLENQEYLFYIGGK
jgi:hypothetical protein